MVAGKKWQKGQSGNPKGRPKNAFNYAKELGIQLTAVDPNDPQKRTNGQIAVAKQVELWKMGSVRAGNEILDRLLGKPPQALAIANVGNESRDEMISNILESLRILRESAAASESNGEQPIIQ